MNNFAAMSDDTLAEMYVSGDNKAFDELLSRYEQSIYSYIIYMVKDRDKANDLFQDVFVKVISSLHSNSYRNHGLFNNWLMRIVHNIVVDSFRRNGSCSGEDCFKVRDIEDKLQSNLTEHSMEDKIVNSQVLAEINHLVAHLPDNQREVVEMRYFRRLSFKEIAETTDVSINTSLGRMRYALHNLRKMAKENDIYLKLIV